MPLLRCKGNFENFVIEAVTQKFAVFGFFSHAPLPIKNDFAIKEENIQNYVNEIYQLHNKYVDKLPLFVGLEYDYIPRVSALFRKMKEKYQLDYIIGEVHLVKKAVGTYFEQLLEMIKNEQFDVIAHLDKIKMHNQNRFFQEDEKWYMDWIEETLCLIKEKLLIVEINTRGLYKKRYDTFYPSPWIIKKLKELSIPVTISTDSHHCNEISLYFNEAKQCLKYCRIQEVTLLTMLMLRK